ncbi:response regulator transcription factor [Rhodoferax sp.]|uniref:response regulator transcription factor n=1 Tax=Rhodoferax sp. TaxID=50421 RepID=UPI002601DF8D|nr:response regulator transcription factor [Rhodoferax sp.]MDD2919910.1 response regulator transcription factor [Rhodoferax sp.]
MKLLLIEDDTALHTALSRSLNRIGWQVEVCVDGRAALPRWRASHPDVVLLDLTLPGRDGLAVLQQARDEGLTTPVLILTARGTVGDRVQGLNAGADDYLPKPFDLDELEARVRALLRRHPELHDTSGASQNESAGLRYDPESKAIHHAGQVLDLSSRELAMLRALLARAGQAVTKERLFELVFPGQAEVQFEAIEVVAYRLRKKLQGTGATLTTLRGLGYLLKLESGRTQA